MTAQNADRAYLARFESLTVIIDNEPVVEPELSRPADRTRRAAIEGRPVPPKMWGPHSTAQDWHACLSSDEQFVSKAGRVIKPPKGGFYALWRKGFAGWADCSPLPGSL